MLKNYLKITLRNLYKHKLYSVINIFGLAVGIGCCVLIGLYVYNEWSYDSFHDKSDRIYRAWGHEDYGDGDIYFNTVTPLVLAQELENHIPEVEETAHFYNFNSNVKRPDQDSPVAETVSMVEPSFFRIFDFPFISGNSESVFLKPGEIILTEETAKRYFGKQDPLYQTLSLQIRGGVRNFTVTGVVQDPQGNSSIQFGMLIPFLNKDLFFGESVQSGWFNVVAETYVLLRENVRHEELRPKLDAMMNSVLSAQYGAEYSESGLTYTVGLQPLTDIRHNTEMPGGILQVTDPMYSYILSAVALLVLVIACVNFMSLSISRSASRAREVGIRKTVGAQRRHLMYQFWGEALIMTIFSMALGILLAELFLPRFNALSGTELALGFEPGVLLVLLVSAVVVSLVAGVYPALVLSGFKPVKVLKGHLKLTGEKNFFRQGMVIFQFSLSIALIAGTLLVGRQLNFMRSSDLGYQKEQVVVLTTAIGPGPGMPLTDVLQDAGRLKNRLESELASFSGLEQMSLSLYTPVQTGGWIFGDFRESGDRKRDFHVNIVDHEFVDTYDIDLLQGRSFSSETPSDERRAILVNKALVDEYGWENPIGKQLPGPKFEDHEIVGVVKNFHYQSMHTRVEPLVLTINPRFLAGLNNISFAGTTNLRVSLRLGTNDLSTAMDEVEKSWVSAVPGTPFNYTFVDQAVDSQYRQEERLSRIVAYGSVLAIVIACMGLFGLASLMIVRRTKEIGVRKVLGASTSSLVLLVIKEFTKLVGIAFIIASPIAWYGANWWLQEFAYRIDIGIGVFLLAGFMALGIAWITVSYQSYRAARINPVESLRSE